MQYTSLTVEGIDAIVNGLRFGNPVWKDTERSLARKVIRIRMSLCTSSERYTFCNAASHQIIYYMSGSL